MRRDFLRLGKVSIKLESRRLKCLRDHNQLSFCIKHQPFAHSTEWVSSLLLLIFVLTFVHSAVCDCIAHFITSLSMFCCVEFSTRDWFIHCFIEKFCLCSCHMHNTRRTVYAIECHRNSWRKKNITRINYFLYFFYCLLKECSLSVLIFRFIIHLASKNYKEKFQE